MSPGTINPLAQVKAVAFDVFGTVVDWRTSVVDELVLRAHRKLSSSSADDASNDDDDQGDEGRPRRSTTALSLELRGRLEDMTNDDWARFAQAWRDTYSSFTQSFDASRDAWKSVDQHHRESLELLLREWGLGGVYSHAELDSLSLVWHRLVPWPDSADGLHLLSSPRSEPLSSSSSSSLSRPSSSASGGGCGLVTTTLSNGNASLLRDLDDFGSLGFQRLLSAETFGAYKPSPATYLGAARELGLEPGQVAMVAAHLADLRAARACGLRTIYVERDREEAWSADDERHEDARGWVDLWVARDQDGLRTVARRLRELLRE